MHKIAVGALFFLIWACGKQEEPNPREAYAVHCGSCHLPPKIEDLPKDLWSDQVLPEMAARVGIATPGYDPMSGLSFEERIAVMESRIFPVEPVFDEDVFRSIETYILAMAPDSLPSLPESPLESMDHYQVRQIPYPGYPLPSFTYLNIRSGKIEVGDLGGNLSRYDMQQNAWENVYQFESPVVGFAQEDSVRWALTVGILDPSERRRGKLYELDGQDVAILLDSLHRPVFLDVSGNGEDVNFNIAEFGHYTGRLSTARREREELQLTSLVPSPGALCLRDSDIDGDNLTEKLVLFAQGDERLVAIKEMGGSDQQISTLIRFSPLSGVSWFEMADVDGDGDQDIITVHGDNADKTYVQKPYHGIRIHSNDGKGRFTQVYNYPMNGATRVVATDWDLDGDPDLAVVAAFPDYNMKIPRSFILLENKLAENAEWQARSFDAINKGRWFLMDASDLDGDGDQDIVLGVFNYHITPVPESFLREWNQEPMGLLILENTLSDSSK